MTREYWTEFNIFPCPGREQKLLLSSVYPLVCRKLKGKIETWFFFWEPELRLRVRWKGMSAKSVGDTLISRTLNQWIKKKLVAEWHEGNHGRKGAKYLGEGKGYGDKYCQKLQKDWMFGSEFAVGILRGDFQLARTMPKEYHWKRRVHLFSNQLFGAESKEIELCLENALRRLELMRRGAAKHDRRGTEIVKLLKSAKRKMGQIEALETAVTKRWFAAGKPDWRDFLRLR